jgi:hypothetical protein
VGRLDVLLIAAAPADATPDFVDGDEACGAGRLAVALLVPAEPAEATLEPPDFCVEVCGADSDGALLATDDPADATPPDALDVRAGAG